MSTHAIGALLLVLLELLFAVGCEQRREGAAGSATSSVSPAPRASARARAGESSGPPAFDPSQLGLFAPIPEGIERPATDDATKLGQSLYFDVRLSGGQDVACASCHDFDKAGADGAVVPVGSKRQSGKRNTPTVINAAASYAQGWTARATTVEELVAGHLVDPAVMAMPDEKRVVDVLTSIPGYVAAFKKAFPDEKPAVSMDTVGRAFAAFVKKLFGRGRWDRYLGGEKGAVTDAELAGLAQFVDAGCTSCHQGKYLGATQSQKLGIAKAWPAPAGVDPGRYEVTKQEADRGVFKVPSLRNVTRTAPYLHDGSIATLDETVRLMARHQAGRELSAAQSAAIVAFLGALSGDPPKELLGKPALPPSGPRVPKSQ